MATLETLNDVILDIIQDPSITSDTVTSLINQGIRYIASQVLLPELSSEGPVETVVGSCATTVPSAWNFERILFNAEVEGTQDIQVVQSKEELHRVYPNYETELQSGLVEFALVTGSNLTYYPIPTEITEIFCKFYTKPTPLVSGTDEPVCIPEALQEDLLENFTLWKLYTRIEDGVEGRKVNTVYYKAEFYKALETLEDTIDEGQSRALAHRLNSWI